MGHIGRSGLLSSQNLIRNSGAALMHDGRLTGWADLSAQGGLYRRIPAPGFNRQGLPHAAHAIELVAGQGGTAGLEQTLAGSNFSAGRYVFRTAARNEEGGGACDIAICYQGSDGSRKTITRFRFVPTLQWARYRHAFDLTRQHSQRELFLEIRASGEEGPIRSWITDLRLIKLHEDKPGFSVRFDTRGDFLLPSSRLRAYQIEDYLNLIGWQASLERNSDFDLLVCQKVRHWAAMVRARLGGRAVIYDLDDNEPAQSWFRGMRIRAFSHAVNGITAGGEYLLGMLSVWNRNAYLFDNIVDVLDRDLVRPGRNYDERLVWFGMPENAWEVERLSLSQKVTRITRGGDIDYDVKTIDAHLISFDLALLPITLTPHSRAKNANRLIKCAALGVPFLAGDSPEHRRALALLGLPDSYLVGAGEDWSERIFEFGRDYDRHYSQIAAAKARVYNVYGIERITRDWIDFCETVINPAGITLQPPS